MKILFILKNLYYKNIFAGLPKEIKLLIFFGLILFLLFLRLFYLQVVKSEHYQNILYSQHYTQSLLKAKRWNIYLTNESWKRINLTENVDLYTIYVDPEFVKDKDRFINVVAPVLYTHFCVINWLEEPTKTECINNIEKFTWKKVLQEKEWIFYMSWSESEYTIDTTKINDLNKWIIENYSKQDWISYISTRLRELIKTWYREKNYLWFFEKDEFLESLKRANLPYIFQNKNYVYIVPDKVWNIKESSRELLSMMRFYWYSHTEEDLKLLMSPRKIRYVKLISNVNSEIAKIIKDLKVEYYEDTIERIPLLHWIGLEKYERRIYPYWSFLSHVLWYVDKNWDPFYGLEKYYDTYLRWKDWKLIWLSVPWIWNIWSNSIEMSEPIDWSDIYLTINMALQERVEEITKYYYNELNPDSISVLVMDPDNWKIRSSYTYPNFDPNNYDEVYKIRPLWYDDRNLIDDDTYLDIPILLLTGDKLTIATYDERKDPFLEKYIFKNTYWPNVFVDKNIAFPYEPWSIFKTFTLWIWLDSDQIWLYDLYEDEWSVDVWPYTISNIHKECLWTNTFLNSLEWSCNVWMVRIAQRIWRYVYYNYLQKIWFWKNTWIELFWEDPWSIPALNRYSKARFFNNSFWQWILTTPIQLAVWYSALLNWWYLVKPTIIEKVYDKSKWEMIDNNKQIKARIFKKSTVEDIKEALFKVVDEWDLKTMKIDWYSIWWKTWTSQIAFKWKYQQWEWWTNGSFVGMTTKEDLRYVIMIQVRRPRANQWWSGTAWKIFKTIAKTIIENEWIIK